MTEDEIKQELDDAEFSIEIDCLRDPDYIKLGSGAIYRPQRTAHMRLMTGIYKDRAVFICDECATEVKGSDKFCSLCGSMFV